QVQATQTIVAQAEKTPQDQVQFALPPNTQPLAVPMTAAKDALEMIELPEGFTASLFAAEPDVHQPIAITTDAKGRLWVAECYTYSDRKENYNTELNDRIVIFEDTDHDGVFDTRKVFWDKFKKLTSVEVGMGGVWVTAAPNLLFIPDANGDDIPDGEPQVMLNGFEGDVIRHNIVNGLRWGPDGWLYGRHGIQATSFVGPPDATDSQRVAMNCAIWRYHPLHHKFEIVAQGGTNPWGFDYDEHGEMFMINTVIGHLFHIVPNARYRRMYGAHFNPHLYQVIEQTADHFHWDTSEEHWAAAKKEGLSDGTDLAGGGHAHTGLMIYQGGNWPKEFHNQLFTANFHGRRLNSDSIQRQGNSYVAHHGPDYFKTADPWFRGVEMVYGPDGGVFLLDWSDIGECHENDGIHRTSGRIFKLSYGKPSKPSTKMPSSMNTQELIAALDHSNEWYSRKARRLLQQQAAGFAESRDAWLVQGDLEKSARFEFAMEDLHRKLKAALRSAKSAKSKLRLMWALYSCGGDHESWFRLGLHDPDEHVRSWTVRLLADGLVEPSPEVATLFTELAKTDPSGLVRLYLASSLPRLQPADALNVAAALASHAEDSEDRVQPKLLWYGLEPLVTSNVEQAVKLANESPLRLLRRNVVRRLTNEIENDPSAAEQIAASLLTEDRERKIDFLLGMNDALNGWSQAKAPSNWASISKQLASSDDEEVTELVQKLDLVFGDGRALVDLKAIVSDNAGDVATRRRAIATLSQSKESADMFEFLKPHLNNKALTTAVVQALSRVKQPQAAKAILNRYRHMDPAGQAVAVNVLVTREPWARQLLNAVAGKQIASSNINASHARQMLNFQSPELTKQLTDVWGEIRQTSAERAADISQLRDKLSTAVVQQADLETGQIMFEKNCANCHTMFGRGGKLGPDLTGADRKNLNYLLENIVDPSASVAESYQTSVIQLDDGRLFTGVVIGENERTMQLQTKDELMTIDLKSIDAQRQTKKSLMPEGLLDSLSDQDIAALVRFLQN
ncbi:MAG: putative membrane-bound dehydrogenase-like protein, partial [Mariniblastus sp.]